MQEPPSFGPFLDALGEVIRTRGGIDDETYEILGEFLREHVKFIVVFDLAQESKDPEQIRQVTMDLIQLLIKRFSNSKSKHLTTLYAALNTLDLEKN